MSIIRLSLILLFVAMTNSYAFLLPNVNGNKYCGNVTVSFPGSDRADEDVWDCWTFDTDEELGVSINTYTDLIDHKTYVNILKWRPKDSVFSPNTVDIFGLKEIDGSWEDDNLYLGGVGTCTLNPNPFKWGITCHDVYEQPLDNIISGEETIVITHGSIYFEGQATSKDGIYYTFDGRMDKLEESSEESETPSKSAGI